MLGRDGRPLVATTTASQLLGVPAKTIASWAARHQLEARDFLPGPGRAGRVPFYDLADLEPLAQRWASRRHRHRDTPR